MSQTFEILESTFDRLLKNFQSERQPNEHFTLTLTGETSQFVRFNHAKVRQIGSVTDCQAELTLMANQRAASFSFPLCGDWETDWQAAKSVLQELRQDVAELPIDPYSVLPSGTESSREVHVGRLLPPDQVASMVLPEVAGLDFAGIYGGGRLLRAYADSVGQTHWFETESFALDYSIFTADNQAVKGVVAGSQWDKAAYVAKLANSKRQLERLADAPKPIPKGQYRTYLAPQAIAEIIAMFSWGAVGEAAIQQGESAFGMLRRGEKYLSPAFTLNENFGHGLVPRFNNLGEMAPVEMAIIDAGKLVNSLVNSRTAKEYNKVANGANGSESLRSPEVCPGTLATADILKALDTGLYLSNLHYLNWSDRPIGRITGMTRYACFWVENGEIVAPIENLRFDESLYRCLGDNLLSLTDVQEFIPEVGSYDYRSLGGMWLPGVLVDDFTYTL